MTPARIRPLLLIALLLWIAHGSMASERPTRVVSINLCTDQLLLLLAEPDQIASVSRLALEPNSSYMAEAARGYPPYDARIQQLLALRPDLILASEFSPRPLLRLLERLDQPVVLVPLAGELAQIHRNIRQVAALLAAEARAERLIAEMNRRIEQVARQRPIEPPGALFYQPRGYSSGSGTLQDQALRLAGWRNLAAELGLEGYGAIDLEQLLAAQPQQLFTSAYAPGTRSRAQRQLDHPALRRVTGGRPLVDIPYRYWICGGPMFAEAVERLAAAHRP